MLLPASMGLTWKEYDANLERNLEGLHAATSSGSVPGTAKSLGECTYRSRMADSARSRSPHSKTKSSKERRSRLC